MRELDAVFISHFHLDGEVVERGVEGKRERAGGSEGSKEQEGGRRGGRGGRGLGFSALQRQDHVGALRGPQLVSQQEV